MTEEVITATADQLIAIVGYSTAGKSASLRNIRNQGKWLYINCESGKRLPFKNQFNTVTITDPMHVHEYLQECIDNPDEIEGVIIDSITFLMEMYESVYVVNSANTMAAWGSYAQFFKKIMQELIPKLNKPVIIIAHVKDELDEKNMEMKTSIPVKGSLKNNGIEAYFTTVVAAKKISLKELEKYSSGMLNISEEEKELGFKHVFQTRHTKATTGERIRSPMGMFDRKETYVDNDAQILLDHLKSFYG